MAYETGFSRAAIFVSYAALGALLFGVWAYTIAGADSEGANDDEELDEACTSRLRMRRTSSGAALASTSPAKSTGGGALEGARACADAPLASRVETSLASWVEGPVPPMQARGGVPELHDAPLLRQLTSSQLVVGLVWYLLSQQRINLYLGTARTLLAAQGDATGYYAALHTALLPAGLAFVPLVAVVHGRYGVLGTMQLNTLMGAAHCACAIWLPLDSQWITFSLFTCLRMASFATCAS